MNRRVPPQLWITVTVGNNLVQVGWVGVAATQVVALLTVVARAHPAPLWDSSIAWTYGLGALFSVPFFTIGVLRARRDLRLMCDGRETLGTLIRKRESYSNKTLTTYYTFAYTIDDRSYHEVTLIGDFPYTEDKRPTAMLYDPDDPDQAILTPRASPAWRAFVLPAIALTAAVWMLVR